MTHRFLALLLVMLPLPLLASDSQQAGVKVDVRKISASLEDRRQWVTEQAEGSGTELFERDYLWILSAKSIGPKEALQLAYLFWYSTGTMGGYFDSPVKEGNRWKFKFHSELGPTEGFPVFVEEATGLTWQEGQTEKVDTLALIKLFSEQKTRRLTLKENLSAPSSSSSAKTEPSSKKS